MIDCMIADELTDRHIKALNEYSTEDTWEVAMARKAAIDLAWGIVCEHRAICPACRGAVSLPTTITNEGSEKTLILTLNDQGDCAPSG